MSDEIGSHLAGHFNNCFKLIQDLGIEHNKFNQHHLKKKSSGPTHRSDDAAAAAAHNKARQNALRKGALPKRVAGHTQTTVVPPKKGTRTIPSGTRPHDDSHSGPAV